MRTLSLLVLSVTLVVWPIGTEAAAKRFPPAPSCPGGGPWMGTFSGTYEAGMFRDNFYTFFGRGCFASEAACRRWIYDVRSTVIFHQERQVRCEKVSN